MPGTVLNALDDFINFSHQPDEEGIIFILQRRKRKHTVPPLVSSWVRIIRVWKD